MGTRYNHKIDMEARRFIAVTDSAHLLKKLQFDAIFVDEAHHPLAPGLPGSQEVFRFSATHKEEVDYEFRLGEAIEQGVLCDYDLTVPVATEGHPYICLANLLLLQSGRFRRVLAYCNSRREAGRFQKVLETVGLAAWHMNGQTSRKGRAKILRGFAGELRKPVHVLVTVQVLGEGVNIPNADTCMFVEPRSSFVSIIQAIGRVLRHHPSKPLAHVVLPALTLPTAAGTGIAATADVPGNLEVPASERPPLGSAPVLQAGEMEAEASQLGREPLPPVYVGPAAQEVQTRSRRGPSLQERWQPRHTEVGRNGGLAKTGTVPALRPNPAMPYTERHVSSAGVGTGCISGTSSGRRSQVQNGFRSTVLEPLGDRHGAGLEDGEFNSTGEVENAAPTNISESLKPTGGHCHRRNHVFNSDVLPAKKRSGDLWSGAGRASPALGDRLSLGEFQDHLAVGASSLNDATRRSMGGNSPSSDLLHVAATESEAEVLVPESLRLPSIPASGLQASSPRRGTEVDTETTLTLPSDLGQEHQSDRSGPGESWTNAHVGSPSSTHGPFARQPGPKRRIKESRGPASLESAYADQLDRFLQAIGRSDTRFLRHDAKQLQACLWVTDCRLNQDVSIHSLLQELALELTQVLRQRDPWEVRLEAVERFVTEHGRLPRGGGPLPTEHALANWLAKVGMSMKRQQLSAVRVRKVLNSSDILRTRVSKWLDCDMLFKLRCRDLKEFVQEHRRLPGRSKRGVQGEVQLHRWLDDALTQGKGNARRLQLLKKVDPMLEARMTSKLQRGLKVQRWEWGQQLKKLVRLVTATGRLPQQSRNQDAGAYRWLLHQRLIFQRLPMDLQADLLDSHPRIASYLKLSPSFASRGSW